MTDSQMFQLIGIIYTAAGLGGFINPDYYRKIVDSFDNNPALTYITAMIVVVAGFILVTFHNVWVMGWPVIITVFGYAALIKGIALLIFPRAFLDMSRAVVKKLGNTRLYAVVVFIIGLGLSYLGFLK